MKLRSDAGEWKSDAFVDMMYSSELGRGATDILVERACLHRLGRLYRFSFTTPVSAASDATHRTDWLAGRNASPEIPRYVTRISNGDFQLVGKERL